MKVLAGDIGGTKTLLAVFDTTTTPFRVVREEKFVSHDFDGLSSVVRAFFAHGREPVEAACFAIAGPVKDGECVTPNLPWHVSATRIVSENDLPRVELVNDFHAVGYGLDQLGPADLATLQEGKPAPRGPRGVLGAGTGLGEAFLLWDGAGYHVHASEGGHGDFAPRNALECRLLEFLSAKLGGHVSYERLLSGNGLANIYDFLVSTGVEKKSPDVARQMETDDHAAVISKNAFARTDAACVRALDLFASIYGAEAGNIALRVLATGGVYVAGGIAPRIIEKLRDGTFVRAFREKGRLGSFVESVPVHVVMNTRVGLLGAASQAARPTS